METIQQVGSSGNAAQNLPTEMRALRQWCVAGDDKAPRTKSGLYASVQDPTTWMDFDTACRVAVDRGWGIGFVLAEDDPFACIDLDVKESTPPEDIERFNSMVATFDSYTERSRSGRGLHIWVRGHIGKGFRRDGVEVYSQARFIICTGSVVLPRQISDRQDLLNNMVSRMRPVEGQLGLWGDDSPNWHAANIALEDRGELEKLFRGDWQGGNYPSQSEADLMLVKLLLRHCDSPRENWKSFLLSALGKRDKARRPDYALSTVALAMQHRASDLDQIANSRALAEGFFWNAALSAANESPTDLLDRLTIDWFSDEDAEVPDIVGGLVADEDVTLHGGHGGVGKSLLALQMACAVALGKPILGSSTRQSRVLYYSAEDGKKRLNRRLRAIVESAGHDKVRLTESLRVLDASEVDPLYGEELRNVGAKDKSYFMKHLGETVSFVKLQGMVEAFDPQLVIIDGASDTFDGNEIARREVRAFIKLLRRVHPTRKVGVMLMVHIDRSSARGNTTNDDGYAGSAQWHNSCRRRLWLQAEVMKDEETRTMTQTGTFYLRIMKN